MSSASEMYTGETFPYFKAVRKSSKTTECVGVFRKLAIDDDGLKRKGMFNWLKGSRWHQRFFYLNVCANPQLFSLYDSSLHTVFDDVEDDYCAKELDRVIDKLSKFGNKGDVRLSWFNEVEAVSDFVVGSSRFLVNYSGNIVDKMKESSLDGRSESIGKGFSKIEDKYFIWAKVESVHGPTDKYPTSKRGDMVRYYTYYLKVKGRKKNKDKDGSLKRWSIDLEPRFPRRGVEFDAAEREYLKRRNDIFATLYICLNRIDHCNPDVSKMLVGILANFGVGYCIKMKRVAPWWTVVLHKAQKKVKSEDYDTLREADMRFIRHGEVEVGDEIALLPEIDRCHAFDCELKPPTGKFDKDDVAYQNAEFEFDVDEEEEQHIGDLFLTSSGYGVDKARWDLAVKISHCNKQLALACSDDKKVKVIRKTIGDKKMKYWPDEKEIVFHLFGKGFNTSITRSRKCYTVDIQEIISNVTERWLYSTHVRRWCTTTTNA